MRSLTGRLFVEMLREEYRIHTTLFGHRRFTLFPVLLTTVTATTAFGVVWTGTDPALVLAGAFALVFVFGLHTGSIGLVGRDELSNLLGEQTRLVFSARTLPVSPRRLLAVFVASDVVFYALLFLAPIALGLAPVVWLTGATGGGLLLAVSWLWLLLMGTFGFGLGVTIAAIGLAQRGRAGLVLVVAVGVALAAGTVVLATDPIAIPIDPVGYTPYGLFRAPTIGGLVATAGALAAVFLLAARLFDVQHRQRTRQAAPAFRRWNRRVGEPLTTKTLLDVHRSAGGFGAVVFSVAVLFAVTVGLVDLAGRITGVGPSVAIAFGAILGLSAFTTYNWLTQYDDIETYRSQPVRVEQVFAAKRRAFVLLGPAVALVFYALAVGWQSAPLGEVAVGVLVLVATSGYIFDVTIFLAGLSPTESLFDTVLFALFGLAMMVALLPILVVAFTLAPLSPGALVGLAVWSVGLAAVGTVCYRRAIPRWTARYRHG